MTWLVATLLAVQIAQAAPAAPIYVPQRVYDTTHQRFSDLESMVADLARADVIFVGEQHDDPNTHRLEAAILEGLRRRGIKPIVSLEMFERDVQATLDRYLSGAAAEEEFLTSSRPWPRYATDYRPIVELAKAQGWTVVAANVPRRYASSAAKAGKSAVDDLPPQERESIARDLQCPLDGYFDRFKASMAEHPVPGSEKLTPDEQRAATERYYFSQCVKDETMAEAIAAALNRAKGPIVHFNGAFHSDFGQGTVSRARRRLEGRRIAVVTVLPVKDLDTVVPSAEDLRRADYLLFTVK
jgi:uncharacterized iron-regulated protein